MMFTSQPVMISSFPAFEAAGAAERAAVIQPFRPSAWNSRSTSSCPS